MAGRCKSAVVALAMMGTAFAGVVQQVPQASAAVRSSVATAVEIDGQKLAALPVLTVNGKAYVAVPSVMQALRALGVATASWNGHRLGIANQTKLVPKATPSHGNVQLFIDSKRIYAVNAISVKNHSTGKRIIYLPLSTLIIFFTQAGVVSTWNGKVWDFTRIQAVTQQPTQTGTPSSSADAGSGTGSGSGAGSVSTAVDMNAIAAFQGASTTVNSATSDQADWQQASDSLYVSAETTDPGQSSNVGPALMVLQPGQEIYLFAYSDTADISTATWTVNSSNATIGPGNPNTVYRAGDTNHVETEATFVADKPGIYTIQAQSGTTYSVPLVITVGLSQLSGTVFTEPSNQTQGILPLPTNVPAADQRSTTPGTSYFNYTQDINGWVPVKGSVQPGSATDIVVEFSAVTAQSEWNYIIPVNSDGTFGALLRDPIAGQASVSIIPHYFEQLNRGSWTSVGTYTVKNTGPAMTDQDKGLLASASVDYNMSPVFNQVASQLMRNAPTVQAGAAAIANYVGDKILYDWKNANAGTEIWQNSTTAWQTNSGVCQDIAEMTAAMLRSIGLPTETVIGNAPLTETTDDHEWIRVWLNSSWMYIDPTWNSPSDSTMTTNSLITSQYMTQTSAMTSSHRADPVFVGTWQ